MLAFYQNLLRLYPGQYRRQFGNEMLTVFREVWAENKGRRLIPQAVFYAREIAGLVLGAALEHLHALAGVDARLSLSTRRLAMRNGFRFPKSTELLHRNVPLELHSDSQGHSESAATPAAVYR